MTCKIALTAILAISLGCLAPAAAAPPVERVPVEFRVLNVNRSKLPCSADGKPYVIRGELVMPAGPHPGHVTLALHEFSFGRFFWSLPGHPGYDIAARMAAAGHPWLLVDRLGYDDSDHPPGTATCLGAQADIAAQLVRALASGAYRFAAQTRGPSFGRILLAGHSVGAGIAELAAHSFPDLPLGGLAMLGWADQSYSTQALQQSLEQGADCAQGGASPEPGAPMGYAFFGRTPERFQRNMFFDADPAVTSSLTARRNRDPCGDNASLARLAAVNRVGVGTIRLPVLLLFGDRDPIFMTHAARQQAAAFTASPEVRHHTVPRAAHALTWERTAPVAFAHLGDWLDARRRAAAAGTLNR